MKIKIYPSKCSGEIKIPSSKSMGHRAIICASLANGKSIISNLDYSDDILATIDGMRKLGANIQCEKDKLIIEGIKNFDDLKDNIIDCNESGSTLRFFIPIFSLTGEKISFTGKNRLLKRPQKIYEEIFKEQNLYYFQDEDKIEIEGKIKAKEYFIDGNISSQFISGLLFTLPLLEENSIININPPFESASYIDLTMEVLKEFGITINKVTPLRFEIQGGQKYIAKDYKVEGDFSQLAFFAVLGALNNNLKCTGVNLNSKQGDKAIIDILKKSGVKIEEIEEGYLVQKGKIKGCEIDLGDCPDLGPILNVLAMYGEGEFKIFNAGRLRLKESDRISAMEEELKKLGVEIETTEDEIKILGKKNYLGNIEVFGHKDHRIVMSLAIAGTMLEKPIIIDGAEAVEKSYPKFFQDLESLNIKIEYL
ncbi:MAG: 3-phosphoshikimate 1-carboxyvinyltransferase [Fusobacterium sp.]|uniref:3-phosphoshikimate 1-carboxyvinyltransferase n=1 Tax=Fusobacterium sp. TaxID=68766 RepID=UPI002942C201|nr:3-phosphoshikimate 1-carboxyvinyltransferase [Fusobacterium sp.]MDY3059883.1 3-phosphoshikimate 1-carboxyvinyltransferase [Fusobacterium sp.]